MVSTTIRIHPFHPFQSVVIFNLPVAGETLDRYTVSIRPFSRQPHSMVFE
jgi:hypothetical protein